MEPLSMLVPCSSLFLADGVVFVVLNDGLCSALSCCPLFSSLLAMDFKSALSLHRSSVVNEEFQPLVESSVAIVFV